ncbi:MAG: SUMF1/EgtB/PvdO family nonheme iron enzyme [Prevotella sp.]|nr:SUMF1/EgtB/PvdO family nonheme iron enzyme [Prevotella sp.]
MKTVYQIVLLLVLAFFFVPYGKAQELSPDQYAHIQSSGKYVMLANNNNQLGQGEEVVISSDYYMAKYAVTNQQWSSFIQSAGLSAPKHWAEGRIPEGKESHPVVWVSAEEAETYCTWLGQQYPGYTFRLPTQGEWEYAACGDRRTVYPWGDQAEVSYEDGVLSSKFNFNAVVGAYILQDPEQLATFNNSKSSRYGEQEKVSDIFSIGKNGSVSGWIDHNNYTGFVYTDLFTKINDTGGYTCSVSDYEEGVSPWGCYNMSGNCWEWTSTIEEATNGAEQGQMVNIIKGGSWYATMASCRICYRGEGRKGSGRYATVGLRVVAEKKSSAGISVVSDRNIHHDIYSLQGIKRLSPQRGVNIIDHKKVIYNR